MSDNEVKEFIDNKKLNYIESGYLDSEAEVLAYADLEFYLTKYNLTITEG